MIKKTKNFMFKLLDPNSGVSSKRFIAIYGVFVLTIIAFLNQIFNLTISDTIVGSLATIILGALGTTAMEKFGKNPNNLSETPPSETIENSSK